MKSDKGEKVSKKFRNALIAAIAILLIVLTVFLCFLAKNRSQSAVNDITDTHTAASGENTAEETESDSEEAEDPFLTAAPDESADPQETLPGESDPDAKATASASAVPTATGLATATPAVTATATGTPGPTGTPRPSSTPSPSTEADGTYKLVVYQGSQSVVAYRSEGGEWVQYRVMICSTGTGSNTPNGNFSISGKSRYKLLDGAYGQYASRITGRVLFHSVPIKEDKTKLADGKKYMSLSGYRSLGRKASHGCVRMTVRDAKWIYDNCKTGTKVEITSSSGPRAAAPPALKMSSPYITTSSYGWDPTDPDSENPYKGYVPEETPGPTLKPTPTPTATPVPTATPEPENTPEVTTAPTGTPTHTTAPTNTPATTPTKEPEATVKPTAAPTPTVEPTPEPTPKPTPVPTPVPQDPEEPGTEEEA